MRLLGLGELQPFQFRLWPYEKEKSMSVLEAHWTEAEDRYPGYYKERGANTSTEFGEFVWEYVQRIWMRVPGHARGRLRREGVVVMVDRATELDFENKDLRGFCIEAPDEVPMNAYYGAGHGLRPTLVATLVVRDVPSGVRAGDMKEFLESTWGNSDLLGANDTPNLQAQVISVSTAASDKGPLYMDVYYYVRLPAPSPLVQSAASIINPRALDMPAMIDKAFAVVNDLVSMQMARAPVPEARYFLMDYRNPEIISTQAMNVFHRYHNPMPSTGMAYTEHYFCNNMIRITSGQAMVVFDLERQIPVIFTTGPVLSVPIHIPPGDTFQDLHADAKGDRVVPFVPGADVLAPIREVFDATLKTFTTTRASRLRDTQKINSWPSTAVRAFARSHNLTASSPVQQSPWQTNFGDAAVLFNIEQLPIAQQVNYMRRLGQDYVEIDPDVKGTSARLVAALDKAPGDHTLKSLTTTASGNFQVPLAVYEHM